VEFGNYKKEQQQQQQQQQSRNSLVPIQAEARKPWNEVEQEKSA